MFALEEKAARLQSLLGSVPDVAVALGSGLSDVARHLNLRPVASYEDLGLPTTDVPGHTGQASGGQVAGKLVVAFEGRSHLYEGYTLETVTRWVHVALAAGARYVALTNAAGGLSPSLDVGDIMLIRDHVSMPGLCGYIGATDAAKGHYPWPRFVALDDVYDAQLADLAMIAAKEADVPLQEGVYAMVWGPTYETPAERRLLSHLGADAVGMSTVPEAIAAHSGGAQVLALSVITNVADAWTSPTHEDVTRVSAVAAKNVARLLSRLIGKLPAC